MANPIENIMYPYWNIFVVLSSNLLNHNAAFALYAPDEQHKHYIHFGFVVSMDFFALPLSLIVFCSRMHSLATLFASIFFLSFWPFLLLTHVRMNTQCTTRSIFSIGWRRSRRLFIESPENLNQIKAQSAKNVKAKSPFFNSNSSNAKNSQNKTNSFSNSLSQCPDSWLIKTKKKSFLCRRNQF